MRGARPPRLCYVGGPDLEARIDLLVLLCQRFDVCAVGSNPDLLPKFRERGLRYRAYPMSRGLNPLLDMYAIARLIRIFREEQPTIVHAFDTKPSVLGRLAARVAGVPVVVGTLPGLGILYARNDWKTRSMRVPYQALQTLACRLSDLTIFQNAEDASEFRRRRVAPAAKTVVIPGSGVRSDAFSPGLARQEVERKRANLGLPAGSVVVTMISRMLRSKGVLDFVAAAELVRNARRDVKFILVGPTDLENPDHIAPDELEGLSRSVEYLGVRNDVKEILELSDVFVLPSYYREGIPRVLLEAAFMGLALVAADVPGSREVVEDGVNGFLVPERDPDGLSRAILRLVERPDLRRRFGRMSRVRAEERFDLSLIAEKTCVIYERLLSGKAAAVEPPRR